MPHAHDPSLLVIQGRMLTGGRRAYSKGRALEVGLLFEQARPYRGARGLTAKLRIGLAHGSGMPTQVA